jgi:hypothetical protein
MNEGVENLLGLGEKNDDADEWVGLAEFDESEAGVEFRVVVSCDTEDDRDSFLAFLGASASLIHKKTGPTWSLWWPLREREDLASLRFDQLGLEDVV